MNLAVTVPTLPKVREETYNKFVDVWQPLFEKHGVELITIYDGEKPYVMYKGKKYTQKKIMGKYEGAIVNFNGGVRNLGFAFIAKYLPEVEAIMALDDDTRPIGDTLQDHIDILKQRVPVSWMSTANHYMRGFPYKVRDEAEVVLSHGVWEGVADWDAPTQLVLNGNFPEVTFPKMPVPKGAYFPVCAMNMMFKRKLLPFIYQAPFATHMNPPVGRPDDILAGIVAKREIDKRGWAAVTGYAKVLHERASNVYKNLQLEAKTIELFEDFWRGDEADPYFKIYREKLKLWQEFLSTTI